MSAPQRKPRMLGSRPLPLRAAARAPARVSRPQPPPSQGVYAAAAPTAHAPTTSGRMRMLPALFPTSGDEAPVAVAPRPVRHIVEMHGNMTDSMRMRVRLPLCTIGCPVNTGVVTGAMNVAYAGFGPSATPAASVITSMYLNPFRMGVRGCASPNTSTSGNSTGLGLPTGIFQSSIARCFSRFRVPSGKFSLHYEPQATSAEYTRFNLAWTSDFFHPVIGESKYKIPDDGKSPDPTVLDESPHSVAFSAWQPWSAEFSCPTEQKYLYAQPPTFSGVTTFGYFEDEQRMNYLGALTCVASNLHSPVVNYIGRLYIDIEWEFSDPVPLSSSTVVSSADLEFLKATGEREEKKKVDPPPSDDDIEELPRALRGALSSAPGGSAYTAPSPDALLQLRHGRKHIIVATEPPPPTAGAAATAPRK